MVPRNRLTINIASRTININITRLTITTTRLTIINITIRVYIPSRLTTVGILGYAY